MGEKWLYNAPIVVFPLAIFPGGKLTMGGKWLYNTGVTRLMGSQPSFLVKSDTDLNKR
jgi:hypothetical protein